MRRFIAMAGIALASIFVGALAAAPAPTPLDRFLDGLTTLRAEFSQQLVDARGVTVQEATGRLVVERPVRFRGDLEPLGAEGGQLMVADGRNLWFYDRDLDQVDVKPADAVLTATPAMLLSGTGDIRTAFAVESLPRAG